MRWFKHISTSHNDEIISELMDEFGAEGYGIWWLILEKIAQLMDESDRCFARFSVKVWANFARVSAKKLQSVVEFLEKKERFILKYEGNLLMIECHNLLKYRDEWTERQAVKVKKSLDKLPSESGETPIRACVQIQSIDTDTDIDIIDNKNYQLSKPESFDACPHKKIIAMFHEKLPELPRVATWTPNRSKHLASRWRDHPSLELWEQFFELVAESKFLMGRTTSRDGRSFKATLPWLVKAENFAKVLEGNYENK